MKTAINFIFQREKATIWVLMGLITVLISSYLYFVNVTIFHAVAGEEIESHIGALNASIAELETTAISIRNAIDLNTARALGYNETKISRYIERRGVSQNDPTRIIR